MINPVIINISSDSYMSLLNSIEKKYVQYLIDLEIKGVSLKHPSDISEISEIKIEELRQTFVFEAQKYGGISNFLFNLHLVHYHMSSFISLQKYRHFFSKNVETVSITVEDVLKLKFFGE